MGGPTTDVFELKSPSHFASVIWKRRPTAGISPTKLTVVTCFDHWDVTNTHGKELLNWSGSTEFYWEDLRLVGFPLENGVPHDIWRPKPMGNKGFNLGPAEQGKLLPSFANSSGKVSDGKLKMTVKFKIVDVNMSEQVRTSDEAKMNIRGR